MPTIAAPLAVEDDDTEPTAAPLAAEARGLELTGDRGTIYGPLDLDVAEGGLAVLHGPQGSGRTSLLLTLAGRMVPDRSSQLVVLGYVLPRDRTAVQRQAAVAGFAGIDELDDSVTVGQHVRERLGWLSPWYRRQPRPDQSVVDAVLAPVFGDLPIPSAQTVVWHLDEVEALLLRIALAMAQHPSLLVVDDLDQVHDPARRALVWDRLDALTHDGLTVIAASAAPAPAPHTVLDLSA
ncbi:ATP-binding cassette domain-containing protein [Cellulomonas sp. URHE0023]|uniref:ATP-binding cassette domain-containing protein n=1 Tax=Cellulomonas sp. URHE0023 TaxID=1380354 RepID=UPI0006922C44|nr:ATP-binding cassette domain-containing protein [Cellulomonas sp. URHE0023]